MVMEHTLLAFIPKRHCSDTKLSRWCISVMLILTTNFIVRVMSMSICGDESYVFQTSRYILQEENLMSVGDDVKLSETERLIDSNILAPLKASELTTYEDLLRYDELPEKSEVFRFIRKMPKGGNLHFHDVSMVNIHWVVSELTYLPDLYYCDTLGGKFVRYRYSGNVPNREGFCDGSWISVAEKRKEMGAKYFDKMLYDKMTTEGKPQGTQAAWDKFFGSIYCVNDLMYSEVGFRPYFRQALTELYEDNVLYVEVRAQMFPILRKNGESLTREETLRWFIEVTNEFKKANPGFIGAKFILLSGRFTPKAVVESDIRTAMALRQKYPTYLIGYDMSGQENKGKPLRDFVDILFIPSQNGVNLPFFFHAGETNSKNVCMDDLQGLCENVDGECARKEKVEVLQEGNEVYSAVLTQTDLGANKNKFYIVQLHKDIAENEYYVWHHWGRIGYKGRHMEKNCGLLEAKNIFLQKFKEKTGNEWEKREQFQKKSDKYDLMKMETKIEFPQMERELKSIAMQTSKLDKKVKELVDLLYNTEIIEKTMESMGYNQNQSPLGKMTHQQVMDGYAALKEVEHCIENKTSKEELTAACTKYYTKIPHKFGMKPPPLITTQKQIEAELELLETLDNIYVAMMILKAPENGNSVDRLYHELKCDIKPLDETEKEFEMVTKYLNDTHESDHNKYLMEMLDVFKVTKELPFVDVGNRILLWHGSRLANWAGILTQGLRIAPPEAPATGTMFGKGVYFADRSSKSCNYCKTDKEQNVGLALLCEVALGESHELVAADTSAHQLPHGKKSVKGLGEIAPDPKENYAMSCGTVVPLGKGIPTNVQNTNGKTLRFNEYVVYDTKQIRMRYLVKIKFNWK